MPTQEEYQTSGAMDASPYQLAILFNNHGVNQLECGDFCGARQMFHGAMEEIKLSLYPMGNSGLANRITNANHCVKWSKNAQLQEDMNIQGMGSSNSFIFRRALVIEPVSDGHLPSPGFEVESTVIIYNCALSLLIEGFASNTSNLLTLAQQLFEIALIRELDAMSRNQPNKDFLHAAICNNLGWIHGEFCNYDLAAHYFRAIVGGMSTMDESALGRLDVYDSQGFMMNLVWSAHPDGAAAA